MRKTPEDGVPLHMKRESWASVPAFLHKPAETPAVLVLLTRPIPLPIIFRAAGFKKGRPGLAAPLLERSADLRYIQETPGHAGGCTTGIDAHASGK